MLYRCFMTVRLWQIYASVNAKRASSTRLDILCECMAFTVSEPQLPMLMRLAALCLALHRKKVSQTNIPQPSDDPGVEKSEDDAIGRLFFYNFISCNEGHLERTSEQIVSEMSKHFCCGLNNYRWDVHSSMHSVFFFSFNKAAHSTCFHH